MGILNKLLGGVTGGLGGLVLGAIDRFKLSPEKKAEMKMAVMENESEMAKYEAEVSMKYVEASSANIRADVASKSMLARTARPGFLWMGNIAIWGNIIVPHIARMAYIYQGRPDLAELAVPIDIPGAVIFLFGSGFLGYTGARSWEKNFGKSMGSSLTGMFGGKG